MEAFIAANRALLDGIEGALDAVSTIAPHYCPGAKCLLHNAAFRDRLEQALADNTHLGEFISEVVAQSHQRA